MDKPSPGGDALPQTLAELKALLKTHLEVMQKLEPLLEAVLQQVRPAAPGADRRAAQRFAASRVQVTITDTSDRPEPFTGRIINYSTTGLALAVDTVVPVGTILTLRPPGADGTGCLLEAQVKHRQQEGRVWRLGCQLLHPASPDELQAFGLEEG